MKLGIGSYTYMWAIGFPGAQPAQPMNAHQLLEKARELGVSVVQYGPNLPLAECSAGDLQELVRQARAWKVEIELGTRGLETDHLRRQIELAGVVGAKLLRTVPELGGGRPSFTEIREHLLAILPDLHAAGVALAMENSTIPAAELAGVLDALNTPSVGITLDTVNSLAIPEGTEQVVRALARHTLCLHVKDFAVKRLWHMMGFIVEGRPAGDGQMNLSWILEQLRDAGVNPNAILELWTPEQKSLAETVALEEQWARKSIASLRRYIVD